MIKKDWAEMLQILYWQSRRSTVWKQIAEMHDDEDREYFRMLDKKKFPAMKFGELGQVIPEMIVKLLNKLEGPTPKPMEVKR